MGWEAAFFSEIEKFPCAVLEHRYPDVPLHGDFTTIKENEYGKIDLLVGGTPCQSFSVAGLRGGLDDDRGNLALEFCRLAQREQPRWIVWENVPGVLSSSGGRDFGSILGALEDLGYGLAYRVLDAQYFGVAQRRRRVFVVGYLGDWRPAAAVLFERHSMSGHSAPSREKRKEATDTAATGAGGSGGLGTDFECDGGLIAGERERPDLAGPLTAGMHKGPRGTEAVESGHVIGTFSDDGTARTLTARYDSSPCVDRGPDVVGTLRAHHPGTAGVQSDTDHIVAVNASRGNSLLEWPAEIAPTLNAAFSDKQGLENQHINGGAGLFVPAVAYSIMPMNSGKDYKARETDISQPLMAGGPVGGNQGGDFIVERPVAYAIQDVRGLDKKQNGKGWSDEGVSYTVDTHATQGVAAYPINTQLGLRGPDVSNTSRDGLGIGDETDPAYTLQANHTHAVAFALRGREGGAMPEVHADGDAAGALRAADGGSSRDYVAYDHPGRFNNIHGGSGEHQDVMPTLEATNPKQIIAHTEPAIGWSEELTASVDLAGTLQRGGSGGRHDGVMEPTSTVRRLTPGECERLQGFPDNFTAIPWRKKGAEDCPDGPRYKALGNSMAVPVMRWIGERIRLVDDCISII
jgi:DNA (cytosine-5)-methyltransferase 1